MTMPNDALVKELREAEQGDKAMLYSDAMDSAVTAYCTKGYLMRAECGDGEFFLRRQLAAAFRAFLENTPESDLVRLARPPAPHGIGVSPGDDPVAEGPQAVARFLSTPSVSAPGDEGRLKLAINAYLQYDGQCDMDGMAAALAAVEHWLSHQGCFCPHCNPSETTPPEPQAVLEGEMREILARHTHRMHGGTTYYSNGGVLAALREIAPDMPTEAIWKVMKNYDRRDADSVGEDYHQEDILAAMQALQRRIVPMDATVEPELRQALKMCAEQFRLYETNHRLKNTEDSLKKADVNRDMAVMCEFWSTP